MLRPAVFLDRDDTINRNGDLPKEAWGTGTPGDLLNPEFAVLLPGVAEALARLKDAGFVNILITNQGGVARGCGTVDDIDAVNDAIRGLLAPPPEPAQAGDPCAQTDALSPPLHPVLRCGLIDAAYACPHHPMGSVSGFDQDHEWRKPNPGMITSAAQELGLDLDRSWMVGDKDRDLDSAMAAGIEASRCLRVAGVGIGGPKPTGEAPFAGLTEAVDAILAAQESGDSSRTNSVPATRITLRAACSDELPRPMADERTKATVLAAARGLAERTGIDLLEIETADTYAVATLAIGRIPAMGFAAELRKITNDWHKRHHSSPLWLEPDRD